jgi:hypothetical protein
LAPDEAAFCNECGANLKTKPKAAARPGVEHDATMRALLPVGRTALSIVAGYLGLASFFIFPGPISLAVGIWAIVDLKKKPDMHGMGRAVFGVVMGILATLVLILILASGAFG